MLKYQNKLVFLRRIFKLSGLMSCDIQRSTKSQEGNEVNSKPTQTSCSLFMFLLIIKKFQLKTCENFVEFISKISR